jgi:YesN/AraC family two-component response regulator
MVVKAELEKLQIHFSKIELGEVETSGNVLREKLKLLDNNLRQQGMELIGNRKNILAEKIKINIIELVHYTDERLKINLSDFLSEKLNYNFIYLSNIFTEIYGTSIEEFFISHVIERVKELLVYHELNIEEISYITHYGSNRYLSAQFKKMTGLAPSQYRHLRNKSRLHLEKAA